MKNDLIVIGHGSGGRLSHQLINDVFFNEFGNSLLEKGGDSAVFKIPSEQIAYTTDSFVIDPIFFKGGDIGKLAVCGTINDLCVVGAIPQYLTLGFIIEEGFPISDLKIIAQSIAVESKKASVLIAAGDTKVVKKGQCDKIFINVSGIGAVPEKHNHLADSSVILPEDIIIVTGTLGDHAISILSSREKLKYEEDLNSDCASLLPLTNEILKNSSDIAFMRDITRGGLATVLNEICNNKLFGLSIDEEKIPIKRSVKAICELYGFDPVFLANEGKIVLIVRPQAAESILHSLKKSELGENAAIVGKVTSDHSSKVVLKSAIGGTRILNMLNAEMLPRIC